MRDKNRKNRGEQGFSLVELLMVTVIIIIVATLAFMQFSAPQISLRRQNVAQIMKQAFERARFDSVKRRVLSANRAHVVVSANTFSLVTDPNNNGVTTDASDSVTTDFAGQNISITGNSMTFPVTVWFDKRGEVEARDASNSLVNPVFLVCNGTCTFSTANSTNANIVLVTPTGTVNLLPGGATVPTFSAPGVTNIPPGTGVKSDVVLP